MSKSLLSNESESFTNEPVSAIKRTSRRLRARRLRVEELRLGEITAHGAHPTFGAFDAKVEDVSAYGLALIIPISEKAPLLLAGDRLDDLTVLGGETPIFRGSAMVRHIAERESNLVVGMELQGSGLDIAEIYRRGERFSFAQRLKALEGETRLDEISPEFKSWVAELRTYLETMKHFLDEEEGLLENLDLITRRETHAQYIAEAAPVIIDRMNRAADELSTLVSGLRPDEHGTHRAFLRRQLMPLIRLSPILRRSYDKPFGYAGDYEVMNMLYREHAEGDSLFARALNMYAAQEPAARANINRIAYLGKVIRAAIERSPGRRARIASIGCGPAREILELLTLDPSLGPRLTIALIDQEERAIKYCERTLGPLAAATGARVEYIKESVRRLLTEKQLMHVLGQRDLIYSAGLFDYLSDRTFSALLSALYDALAPDGLLAIGNVNEQNPTRWFMEYCLDWFLIHRSRERLTELGGRLSPVPATVTVDAEPLGVNLFLMIRR
ncbi:MAG TPA: class I SAM-dependent methyltransferase [Polyangiaceae bacterium]|jgi:extracellular factor (EF) 3-hydroxypalmitic acid methyl ester biosynthesis protein|nr:class I SAM-dependent methyltransferase [Polyangiaceae bacterium]